MAKTAWTITCRRLIPLITVALILVASTGESTAQKPKQGQPEFVIRMHHGLPIGHYLDRAHNLFAEKVASLTGGRVQIKLYPAAQLYSDIDVVQAVMTGNIEACWNYDHKFFTVCPAIGGYGLPGCGIVANTWDDTVKAIEASYDAFYKGEGPAYLNAKRFEDIGLKLIYYVYWSSSPQFGSQKRPVIDPYKDLKGRKVRVTTVADAEMFKSVGAQPISLTGGDLYETLARHVIDCCSASAPHLEERKLKEVLDYVVRPTAPSVCIGQVVVNMAYWKKIPKDLQDLILQAGKETELEFRGVLLAEEEEKNKKAAEKVKFIELTPEQQRKWMDLAYPFRVKAVKDLGPQAIEMWNLCQDFKKSLGIEPFEKIH